MGCILETNDEVLGLERRRESFVVLDLQREYPTPATANTRTTLNIKSEHIFANADGEIEVSREFLKKLVAFFDKPENRKMLDES